MSTALFYLLGLIVFGLMLLLTAWPPLAVKWPMPSSCLPKPD